MNGTCNQKVMLIFVILRMFKGFMKFFFALSDDNYKIEKLLNDMRKNCIFYCF